VDSNTYEYSRAIRGFSRVWRAAVCWTVVSVASISGISAITANQSDPSHEKRTPTIPVSSDSEEQKMFKPKTIADGVVKDDVWFHRGTWVGPNNKEVSVVTSKFKSSEDAATWVNETLLKGAKISERKPLVEVKNGPAIGERMVAILSSEKEGEPLTILVWTEGSTVREIYSVSPEIVFLAEKVFFPHYYALMHAEK
jgi:hypothetical protein